MASVETLHQSKLGFQLSLASIRIDNLRLRTFIGFNPEELIKPQDVVINATIKFDASRPAQSDNENETLDYKVITKQMIRHVENGQFRLLEKLNVDLLKIVMRNESVVEAEVRVDKPHALRFADSVSTTLSATR